MRILVVAPSVDMGKVRGDAIHLRYVLTYWSRNHEVDVIAATAESDCPDRVELLADSSSTIGFLPDYVENSLRVLATTAGVRTDRYDLIYERHHLFGSGFLGTALSGSRKVLEVNGLLVKEHQIRDSVSAGTSRFLRGIERTVLRIADRVVCVSPRIADNLRDRGVPERKLEVVSNGCDVYTFRPIPDAKSRLGWDEETTYLGFVGGLNVWHGVDRVIDALPYILEDEPRTKFVVVGEGPLREKLEKRTTDLGVDDAVEFVGEIPHDRVPVYMSAFDVGTILKHPEIPGSPLKLYEYLACGTPVLGTDDADFDLLKRDHIGATAQYWDSRDVALSVLDLIRDDKDSSSSARSVALDYSWEKVAERALEAATR